MLQLKMIVHGQVQGVGYRYSILNGIETHKLDVTGYVQNLPDGTVEIIVEADIETLKEIKKIVSEGSRNCWVREVHEEVKSIKKRDYSRFEVREKL